MKNQALYSIGLFLVACVFPFASNAGNIYVSGHITSGTTSTWSASNTYYVKSTLTVDNGAELIINPGTPVKFATTTTALIVSGQLSAIGTPANNITFTASSSVTTPGWNDIEIKSGASSTITNASFKYGGNVSASSGAAIYITGGTLVLDTVDVATSTYYSVYQTSGTSTITNSTLHGQPSWYGFDVTGGAMTVASSTISNNNTGFYSTGKLTLTGNKFANSGFSGWMSFVNGASFTPSSSTSTGNEWHGFYTDGTTFGSQTLPGGDLPYVIAGLTVTSNSTLTLGQGALVKFYPQKNLNVGNNGILKVQGTSASSVYFTSIYDYSVYNNTLGSSTSAKAGDWDAINLNSGASSTIAHATIRYGGYNNGGVGSGAGVFINGGIATLDTDDVDTNLDYGVYQASGTSTILSPIVYGETNLYGVRLDNGPMTISSGSVYSNNVGVYSTGQLTMNNNANVHDNSNAGLDISGGTSLISDIQVATNSVYGIFQIGGTSTTVNSDIYNTGRGIDFSGGTAIVSSTKFHANDRGISTLVNSLTANSCDIYQNTYGVYVAGGTPPAITDNAIHANTSYGYYNLSLTVASANRNWWGASVGPGGQAPEYLNFSDATSTTNMTVDTIHNLNGFWAARSNLPLYNSTSTVLLYNSTSTLYPDLLTQAIADWNDSATGMGIVTVSSTSASTTGVLRIYSFYNGQGPCGATSDYPTASGTLDTIFFESSCMVSSVGNNINTRDIATSVRLAIFRHEVGHALGLGHNLRVPGNVMWPYWDDGNMGLVFGSEDKSDYTFLWSTFNWATSVWWPSLLPKF